MRVQPAAAPPPVEELEVVIASMRRRHLRSVLRIEEQVHPRPWSAGLFTSEISFGPSRVYVVAKVGGAVVGYGGLMLVADDGHITTLAVDPAWHRRKIASRLLHVLATEAIARDAHHLTLEVRAGNVAAQRLYQAFGFAPAGVRKGYYAESNEDAIVMWAHDIDGEAQRQRLDALADAIPGRTVVEELR